MNRFKKTFQAVLLALGLESKAVDKNQTLTDEDWAKIEAQFKTQYGKSMGELMNESEQDESASADRTRALEILNSALSTEETPAATAEEGAERLVAELKKSNEILASLAAQAKEEPKTATPTNSVLAFAGPGTTDKHLFGIQHSLFALDRRHNQIAINHRVASLNEPCEADAVSFRSDLKNYCASLTARYKFLYSNKMLNVKALSTGSYSTNLEGLEAAGLGDQYVVRRQDALIAHIIELRDVSHLFPRRSGIQDRELLTNAFFESVSQAWQPGQVFKGGVELQPEMAYVDDSMVKLLFESMKEIERKYIGYLNTDGSDPMKWSMIEWYMLQIYRQIVSEQNYRNINGIYVKPEKGVAGHFNNSGTGVIYTLLRYEHEHKLLPFADKVYNTYTNVTMLDVVKSMCHKFMDVLDPDQDPSTYTVYLNDRHKHWWMECIRKAYGKDIDFSGPLSYMNVVPDTQISIAWVPNMGASRLILIQQPGNIQLLENVPGEMLSISIDTEMEAMRCWSVWKEGCSATFVGRTFASAADLKANAFVMQRIFVNKPCAVLDPGVTKIKAGNDIRFVTGANVGPTAITDIEGAKAGIAYVIEQGATTSNASTISKSGKFDQISKAFSPKAEGDYIILILNSEGNKFLELERCESGKREINSRLQPNVPGNGVC